MHLQRHPYETRANHILRFGWLHFPPILARVFVDEFVLFCFVLFCEHSNILYYDYYYRLLLYTMFHVVEQYSFTTTTTNMNIYFTSRWIVIVYTVLDARRSGMVWYTECMNVIYRHLDCCASTSAPSRTWPKRLTEFSHAHVSLRSFPKEEEKKNRTTEHNKTARIRRNCYRE